MSGVRTRNLEGKRVAQRSNDQLANDRFATYGDFCYSTYPIDYTVALENLPISHDFALFFLQTPANLSHRNLRLLYVDNT